MTRLSLIGALCLVTSPLTAADLRPNFLVILSDDQGYGDLRCYGNTDVRTPHLDRLAKQSVIFRNFHAQPLCSPTRAELMTGRCFLETGVWGVHGGRDYLHLDQRTIANEFRDAGYRTAMIGKWHLGKTAAYLPYSRGFESSWSITGRLYEHREPVLDHNGSPERPKGWTPEVLTDLAIQFANEKSDSPFFIYLAYPEVHEPWVAAKGLVDRYRASGHSLSLATVYAMNEQLDAAVGRLLDSLDKSGLGDNTVVVYLGDNGPIDTSSNGLPKLTNDEMSRRNPQGLRGMKGQLYENGTRVPAMLRWGDKWQPREVSAAADVIDLAPTLLDVAGIAPSDPDRLRGQSLTPLLTGQSIAPLTRPVFYANHEAWWPERKELYSFLPEKSRLDRQRTPMAVRSGRYKLVQTGNRHELYDLQVDPRESIDLSERRPEVVEELAELLQSWYATVVAEPQSYAMPTFVVGQPGQDRTVIPACAPSAIHGTIETGSHSTRRWRRTGDGQSFSLKVANACRLALSVDLSFSPGRGSIVARINDQQISAPLTGDGPARLGCFDLAAGDYVLQLRLAGIEGDSDGVIEELRAVIIESACKSDE